MAIQVGSWNIGFRVSPLPPVPNLPLDRSSRKGLHLASREYAGLETFGRTVNISVLQEKEPNPMFGMTPAIIDNVIADFCERELWGH